MGWQKGICLGLLWGAALSLALGQGPEIYVDIWRYQQIRGNTFGESGKVEVYFRASESSLTYLAKGENQFTATLQVTYKIYRLQAQDSLPIAQKDKTLQHTSSQEGRTDQKVSALIDIQDFELPTGKYYLEVTTRDLNRRQGGKTKFSRDFLMDPPAQTEFAFSDIALLRDDPVRMRIKRQLDGQKYTPDGKYFTPLITNESLVNEDSLVCYVQLYNSAKLANGQQLIERARITQNGRNVFEPFMEIEENPRNFQVFIHTFDISKLANDTYHLTIDLLDNDQNILRSTRKKFYLYNYRSENDFKFFVSEVYAGDLLNEFTEAEIARHIQTLLPISDAQEIQFARVLNSYEQRKKLYI